MPYNETPMKGTIVFKNTPHKGIKNVIARLTMKREDRYRAFLQEYKTANPDWKPFTAHHTLYKQAFGEDVTAAYERHFQQHYTTQQQG